MLRESYYLPIKCLSFEPSTASTASSAAGCPSRLGNHTGQPYPNSTTALTSNGATATLLETIIDIREMQAQYHAHLVSVVKAESTHARPADWVMKWGVGFIPRRCLLYPVSLSHSTTKPPCMSKGQHSTCETSLRYVHQ